MVLAGHPMICCRNVLSRVVLFTCAFAVSVHSAPPERSVSSSRQFIVYGTDARLRGAICEMAERSKAMALRLLGAPDRWKTPIVIQAQSWQSDSPAVRIAQ